jgi:hypothetical protein
LQTHPCIETVMLAEMYIKAQKASCNESIID